MDVALLLAALLHRPYGLVDNVYAMGGIDAVAVVEYESQFNPKAFRREYEGTSWGLFQLWSQCHEQYRHDLLLHMVAGVAFLAECKVKANGGVAQRRRQGAVNAPQRYIAGSSPASPNLAVAYSWYNSGSPRKSIAKGLAVTRLRDRLALRVAEAYGVQEEWVKEEEEE